MNFYTQNIEISLLPYYSLKLKWKHEPDKEELIAILKLIKSLIALYHIKEVPFDKEALYLIEKHNLQELFISEIMNIFFKSISDD